MKMAGSTNTHILEERGVTVNIDDEELYSKVHVPEATPRRERRRSSIKEEKKGFGVKAIVNVIIGILKITIHL